ncbi:MAG: hypothetical protein A3F68_06460 [Acidobacteria bacterium RIFCSPLOWO2_12_FULL_54_10]|nr:MAG: hypothetical protein A3F68_06460 [Acidobacteria bacterium RIFCSPLOWO2_12_FULL_54_10]
MKKVLQSMLPVAVLLLWAGQAMSQQNSSASQRDGDQAAPGPANGNTSNRVGFAGQGQSGALPSAPGVITDTGFANRLGKSVGMRSVSPPSYGNINHPGMQPTILTPQPLPIGPVYGVPNINNPGMYNGRDGKPDGERGRFPRDFSGSHSGFNGVVGIPVYIYNGPYPGPYTVIVNQPPAIPKPDAPLEPPKNEPWVGQGLTPSSGSNAQAPTITLLAFKDQSIVAVEEYWLDGEQIYYITRARLRSSVRVEQLDFSLTQQLNRERNVPFVLETRP